MKSLNQWLSEYALSHQNPNNKIIHIICVPLIMWSLLGLMWIAPTPWELRALSWLNWASSFIAASILFYMMLSWLATFWMLLIAVSCLLSFVWIETLALPLPAIFVGVFVLAWLGQFIGHKIEGKKPSFFEDLQFLLIGPLWILKAFKLPLGESKRRV